MSTLTDLREAEPLDPVRRADGAPCRRAPLVYVIDDDVVTNQMLHGILTRAGYQVATAVDVAGALRGIWAHHPDLVLLDINLPDGSGLDVCRQLQTEQATRQTPVLFISANEDVTSKVRGFEVGGVDYIPKPFAGEEVIARVSTHLRLKQAYEKLAELLAERIQRLGSVQEALMPTPQELPDARFEVSLKQILTAGGDFYDVIPVGDRVVDYVVADSSGHDLASSFWTAALKTLLTEYSTAANSPANIVRAINGALCRILPSGGFLTLVYARLNRLTGRLLLINGGHPPAILIQRGTQQAKIIPQEGDVIGAFPDAAFGAIELRLCAGDRFFLFSDGLIEVGNDREAGLKRLASAVCRMGPLQAVVEAAVETAGQETTPADDVLLMGVEV
ncbi:MAG: fused response regulator/phosphatase [Verrucomicrobiota bacterium]